jgi:hypothetical protein
MRLRSALEPWTDSEGDDIPVPEGSTTGPANDSGAGRKFCWVTTIGERFPQARILTYRYNGAPEDVVAGLMQDLVIDRRYAKRRDQHDVCSVPIRHIQISYCTHLTLQADRRSSSTHWV